uniref:Uncharacterized protein n=1 Tax=Quercus lobata TaxID=97700 RepID=A0A7N2LYT0_QUELO
MEFLQTQQDMLFSLSTIQRSRVVSHAIDLVDSQSDEPYNNDAPGSSHVQSSTVTNLRPYSTLGVSVSLIRLKEKFNGLWLYAVQRWPTVLPIAREFLQLVLCANLMFFDFEGYSYLSKFI